MTNSKVFIVAPGRIVSSIKHEKDFYEGESIDLSHASDADIEALLRTGAVVPADDVTEAEEEDVDNG